MITKIKLMWPVLILMLFYSFAYSQNQLEKVNAYKYIKKSARSQDSFKVKEGYWIEEEIYADSAIFVGSSSDGPKKLDTSRSIEIATITSKGNYSDNMKNGIWQYFSWDNRLIKEVAYLHGHIQSVKFYDWKGHLYLLAIYKSRDYRSVNGTGHFEKYDNKGNKISEGDFPAMLISSGLSIPY